MISIRAKFVRGDDVKYISHLDLMKVFERALRRSQLPIAYSQGFNPHPQMVFGLPLSVGVTSEAEYAEFDLTEDIKPQEFVDRLNKNLPVGLWMVKAKKKMAKANIMATVNYASYEVLVSSNEKMGNNKIASLIKEFLAKQTVVVKKEGKKGIKDVDIRPMIHQLEAGMIKGLTAVENGHTASHRENQMVQGECDNPWILQYVNKISNPNIMKASYCLESLFCLSMLVSAGSAANLKPDLLVQAFDEVADLGIKIVKIHRTGLYVNKEGEIKDPLDDSVLSAG